MLEFDRKMKKNVVKTMVAAVCVAAGVGSLKAYNVANQAESNMLFTENVEALSAGDVTVSVGCLCVYSPGSKCYCNGVWFWNYKSIW